MKSRIYHINSRTRTTGSDSNFSYLINLTDNESKEFNRVAVLGASIPKSYYLVGKNQTFVLSEEAYEAKGPTLVTIQMEEGNYSASSFAAVLKVKLNTNSPNSLTYEVISPKSIGTHNLGKLYIKASHPTIQSVVIKISVGDVLFEQFGFDINSTNTFVTDTISPFSAHIESSNVVNFNLEDTLFIRSNLAKNADNDILQEIFAANTPDFGKITYQNNDIRLSSRELQFVGSNVYNFTLVNEDGVLIDLNGRNMVFTIIVFKE